MSQNDVNQESLHSFLKTEIIKDSKKLKGKFSPFSEIVENTPRTLKIESIYNLEGKQYLIIAKNYSKQPKLRYFFAYSLASQSSDLLVNLAKDFAIKNNLKLIQYAIIPKSLRISLLTLKELHKKEDFSQTLELLQESSKELRQKLSKLKKLVENE